MHVLSCMANVWSIYFGSPSLQLACPLTFPKISPIVRPHYDNVWFEKASHIDTFPILNTLST